MPLPAPRPRVSSSPERTRRAQDLVGDGASSPRQRIVAPRLTPAEQVRSLRRYRLGDRVAGDQLVRSYWALAASIAARWMRRNPHLDNDDMHQEARLALVVALDEYEPRRRVPLAAWVARRVSWHLQECVVRNSVVRQARNRAGRRAFWGAGKAAERLRERGEVASAETIAAELGVSTEEVAAVHAARAEHLVWLDAPEAVGVREGLALAGRADDTAQEREEIQLIRRALVRLPERQRIVIRQRLAGRTLRQIGTRLGVSGEYVRQIERQAQAALREIVEGATC